MVVKVKETSLMSDRMKELKGIDSKEKNSSNYPETELLKRCIKMKASKDGKKVELYANNDEILGVLNREDDAHCNLEIVNGHRIVGRFQSSKIEEKPTWSVYDSNESKTSKMKILDENRTRLLKRLFNDMRNACELALKCKQDTVCFRNRNISDNTRTI